MTESGRIACSTRHLCIAYGAVNDTVIAALCGTGSRLYVFGRGCAARVTRSGNSLFLAGKLLAAGETVAYLNVASLGGTSGLYSALLAGYNVMLVALSVIGDAGCRARDCGILLGGSLGGVAAEVDIVEPEGRHVVRIESILNRVNRRHIIVSYRTEGGSCAAVGDDVNVRRIATDNYAESEPLAGCHPCILIIYVYV